MKTLKISENQKWYSVELSKEKAELFRVYLKEHDIYFEPSQAFGLVHFECLMTEGELASANEWMSKTCQ